MLTSSSGLKPARIFKRGGIIFIGVGLHSLFSFCFRSISCAEFPSLGKLIGHLPCLIKSEIFLALQILDVAIKQCFCPVAVSGRCNRLVPSAKKFLFAGVSAPAQQKQNPVLRWVSDRREVRSRLIFHNVLQRLFVFACPL